MPKPLPKNWPLSIPYLESQAHSPTLTPTHLTLLRTPPQTTETDIRPLPPNTPRGPSVLVKITPITEPTHPACGQYGLFAARDLKPGTFVLLYLGVVHATPLDSNLGDGAVSNVGGRGGLEKVDPHASSDYDLSLDRLHGLGIDAAQRGNEARFINDYRGVAGRANAEFVGVWDGVRRERGVGVWVLDGGKGKGGVKGKGGKEGGGKWKGVRKGEELLVSYGRGFWGARRGGDGDEDLDGEGEK